MKIKGVPHSVQYSKMGEARFTQFDEDHVIKVVISCLQYSIARTKVYIIEPHGNCFLQAFNLSYTFVGYNSRFGASAVKYIRVSYNSECAAYVKDSSSFNLQN